jgi:hypothetical protein
VKVSRLRNITRKLTSPDQVTSEHYRVTKSWYEYYRAIKKLVWILQGDQKVGMNITGRAKVVMNIFNVMLL